MKVNVDIDKWNRKDQYNFFSTFVNPYVSLTSIINVDKIVKYSKKHDISFYGIMSYVVLKAINDIDEFKYVLENAKICKYDKIHAAFSVLTKKNELHFTKVVEYSNFNTFINNFEISKKEAENNKKIAYTECNNKVYITCIPWIRIG